MSTATSWFSDVAPTAVKTPATEELKGLNQWVCWQWVERKGKRTKPPMKATGGNASSTDPSTWATYEQARRGERRFNYDGVGCVLANGYAGVDLDNCRDKETGEILPEAQALIAELDSYTEISPSLTGVKVFVKTDELLPKGTNKDMGEWSIELYSHDRYFTVTGYHCAGTSETINNRTAVLHDLYERLTEGTAQEGAPEVNFSQNGDGGKPDLDKFNLSTAHTALVKYGYPNGTEDRSSLDQSVITALVYGGASDDEIKAIFDHYPIGTQGKYAEKGRNATKYLATCIINARAFVAGNGRDPAQPSPDGAVPAVTLGEKLPDASIKDLKNCFYREELGDGELFASLYPERLVYDHSENNWYLWAGHYWQQDQTQQVKLLFSGQVAAQYLTGAAELTKQASEAKAAQKEERAETLTTLAGNMMKRARDLRQVSRMKHALEYAASLRAVTGDVWDKRPLLLPVTNGVVSLETGELQPGDPSDYLRKYAPTEWQGLNAPRARWEQFILEIMSGDKQMAAYLQRLLGYGISGLSTEHVFPIFWGADGRNGKDTLLNTLDHVLGAMAEPVTKDTVMDAGGRRASGAPEPHIYDLKGKRLVWASESREGERLDAAQVKLVTGGGQLKARPPYGQLVQWEPTHLVILVTNPRPHAPADDDALWSRLQLIPFIERFIDNPTGEHEHEADKRLKDKLRAEASGVLAWLVQGFMSWQRLGLKPPAKVTQATNEYRESEDTLGRFIADYCIEGEGKEARASELVTAYFAWCNEMGIKNPMDGRTFGLKMGDRYDKKRDEKGNVYKGIGLLWQPPKEAQQ